MPSQQGWSTLRQTVPIAWVTPWATGRFYGSPFIAGFTAAPASDGVFRAVPLYVPNVAGVTVAAIGLEVTVAGTASAMRLGLYKTTDEGVPSSLIVDGGSVATTGTGFLSASLSQYLAQGWYYMMSAHSGTVMPTVRKIGLLRGCAFGEPTAIQTPIYHGYQTMNSSEQCAQIVANGLPSFYPLYTDLKPVQEGTDRLMVTL